jgi:hypothetical protein
MMGHTLAAKLPGEIKGQNRGCLFFRPLIFKSHHRSAFAAKVKEAYGNRTGYND